MPIRSLRLSVPATIGFFALALFGNSFALAQAPSWQATIHTEKNVVESGETFYVHAMLRNIGHTVQTLEVSYCTFPSKWTTDNPIVHVDTPACAKDMLRKIRLAPEAANEFLIPAHIKLPASQNRQAAVTFRLGFKTKTAQAVGEHLPASPPVWSNPLTITVTPFPPLEIQIKPTKSEIGNGDDISVITSLRNITTATQVLRIKKCMYENKWISDNPNVRVDPFGCAMAMPENITLNPGQAYTRPVMVHVFAPAGNAPTAELTFRLGYDPDAYTGYPESSSQRPIFWSIPTTITVTRDPAATH